MISSVTGQVIPGMTDPQAAALIAFLNANNVATDESAKTGIPVILVPTGTVAADGVITVGTALPAVYANAWIWLPADAIVGGLAGLYYATFSSTTVGAVKTNYNAGTADFLPFVPAVAVAAVGSAAEYTQLTGADKILIAIPLAANTITANTRLRGRATYSYNSTAGAKLGRQKLGSATLGSWSGTTSVLCHQESTVAARGVASKQVVTNQNVAAAAIAATTTYETQTTTGALIYAVTGQVAVATDYIVVESFCLEQF